LVTNKAVKKVGVLLLIGVILGVVVPTQDALLDSPNNTDLPPADEDQSGSGDEDDEEEKKKTVGVASWYSKKDPGIRRRTASDKVFNDRELWAASWDYPFGTRLKVTNPKNSKSIVVVVEDRGPAKRLKRKIDLTRTAFSRIAPLKDGLAEVEIVKLN